MKFDYNQPSSFRGESFEIVDKRMMMDNNMMMDIYDGQ